MESVGPGPVVPSASAAEVLRARFGHAAFRQGQEAALASVLAGRSLLAVMPTGSGKSLLYQLPALLADGLTLVVSPLIALMKDQVDDLSRRGVPATFVNSSLGPEEQQDRLRRCVRGEVRLLYVAPERFQNAAFLGMLRQVKVARMAVDEAHCISEWGHDFRPDYRRLKRFREELGRPPVTALTATATPQVQKDIVESLGLEPRGVDVHVHGFDRPNLRLGVLHAEDDETKRVLVREFLRAEKGPGIIYVGTRRAAEELADAIADVEPSRTVYHAGMEPEDRGRAQEAFLGGEARVAVATVAFGMGIDKPDVRFVLHYHYPGSVEQYYQEIGRAGRDGRPSRCLMLYSPADRFLREFFIDLSYPTRQQVRAVYEVLWDVPENPVEMTYAQIARRCKEEAEEDVKDGQVASAVRLLDGAGVTRAMAGEASAFVALERPGAEVLGQVRGDVQRRVFEALASALDLETPGRYAVHLGQLAEVARLAPEQVRRALAALDTGGHLAYEPPFRGRGIEKLVDPPPPFDEVPIDWQRQGFLRGLEEEKLEAVENYIHAPGCRRGFILRYFGEKSDLACGTCDRCAGDGPAAAPPAGGVLERRPDIARAVLLCLQHLRFPLGVGRVAQVLTGSQDRKLLEWRLDGNPAYGRVSAKQDNVKHVIEQMIQEGYLRSEGEFGRPVLALTRKGERAARRTALDAPAPAAQPPRGRKVKPPDAAPRSPKAPSPVEPMSAAFPAGRPREAGAAPTTRQAARPTGAAAPPLPGEALDRLIDRVLLAEREEAKALVDDLRLYHPREVAARLAARFDADRAESGVRLRSRAVWAVGELGGTYGLPFLVRCSTAEEANVRRLAASALGKVAAAQPEAVLRHGDLFAQAREALVALTRDAAPQVRQYAEKALVQFPAPPRP